MKKIAITLCAFAALAALAVPAFSTSLLTETFAYPNGALATVGAPQWAIFSGTGTDIQVLANRAVGSNANAPDDAIGFAAQPLNSPTYACFNVSIPDPAGVPKLNYFALLKDTSVSAFFSRVYVVPLAAGGSAFGISFTSVGAATVGPVVWGTPIVYGQVYNIVIKYDPVTLTSTMWVNPSSEADPSVSQTATILPLPAPISISSFGLRQSSSAAAGPGIPVGTVNFGYSVGNLGVGTTFADACGQPVPTRSATWGQLKSIYR